MKHKADSRDMIPHKQTDGRFSMINGHARLSNNK